MTEGQASTEAFLHELSEIHLNGGVVAFHSLVARICGTYIATCHAELETALRNEAEALKLSSDPSIGTVCKHIEACQRTSVARAQEAERAASMPRSTVVAAADDMCDNG